MTFSSVILILKASCICGKSCENVYTVCYNGTEISSFSNSVMEPDIPIVILLMVFDLALKDFCYGNLGGHKGHIT